MLNTFDALAEFDRDKQEEKENPIVENASVDLSSILNRINDIENKINSLLNKSTEIPIEPRQESGGIEVTTNETATNETSETKEGE